MRHNPLHRGHIISSSDKAYLFSPTTTEYIINHFEMKINITDDILNFLNLKAKASKTSKDGLKREASMYQEDEVAKDDRQMEADAYEEDEDEMARDEESDDEEDDLDVVYEGSDTMSPDKEEAYFRDAKDFAGDIFFSLLRG